MQYKLFTSPSGTQFIIRVLDNAFIPFDPANTDYQVYLKWLEDPNNKPIPADE